MTPAPPKDDRNAVFDRHAGDYDRVLGQAVGGFGSDLDYYRRHKATTLKRLVPQARAILDYGCGTGANIAALHLAYPDASLVGCDVSAPSIEEARRHHPDTRFHLLGEEPLPEDAFDLVLLVNVLHHVQPAERPAFLQQVASVLAPGGRLVVFEHNPWNPLTRRVVNACPFDKDVVLLSPSQLATLLKLAGFQDIDQRYTLFFPASVSFLGFLEPFLSRLPLGAQHLALASG